MRIPLLLACGLSLLHGCQGEAFPPAKKHRVTTPAVFYPETVGGVLGVSATPEFLASSVPAAADRKRLARDGFRIARFDMLWPEVETAPGVWNWAESDRIVNALLAEGFTPLVLLAYGHPAYVENPAECRSHDTGVFPCLPPDPAPYVRYAREVAKRYGDRVKHYEIWNEPNGWFRFWPQVEGGDPAAYARLVASTAQAVHEACGDCTVLSGGLVFLPSPITAGQVAFNTGMLAEVPDVFARVDGIGFHAYTFYPPVDAPESQGDMQVPLDEALMSAQGSCQCERPLWVTETGWSAVAGLTHEKRAQYAVRGLLIALSQGAKSWLWWSVRDVVSDDLVAPQEGHFGLLGADGTPHLAYTALVNAMRVLGQATSVTDLRDELGLTKPYEWAVRFGFKDGTSTDVLWYGGRGEGPRVKDYSGRAGTRLTDGKEVTLDQLGAEPVALR